ncbi:MAG: hypothetical protein IT249_06000 [Chitinophagaceae bacterium]|nr:hypothetical protein [Chitinophagaceae bacterium]
MVLPYYLNINFKGRSISARARILNADGSKVYEVIFPTDEKITLHSVPNTAGGRIWKDLLGNSNEFYQLLGNAIEQQNELNSDLF